MRHLIFILVGLGFAGCASLEPEPCSGDWVKWRTDEITRDFRQTFGSEIRSLADFSQKLDGSPSPLLLLQMATRLEDFQTMAKTFGDTVMPELRSAIGQCDGPVKFVGAFSDILAEQGVDGQVLNWVEDAAVLLENNLPQEAK